MGRDLTGVVRSEAEMKAIARGLEVKSAEFETKVLDEEQGIAEMLVAVTGVKDHVNDIIEPGAIGPSLKSRWPKGIWHHTWEQPICKTLTAKELMPGDPDLPTTLRDGSPWPLEAGAFKVTGQFNMETQGGREAFSNVKFFGPSQEWSIGYKVHKATRDKDGTRHIKSMEVPEYSPVLFGAMPLATTLSTKGDTFDNNDEDAETKTAMVNLPGSYEERLDSIEDAIEAMLPSQGIDAQHCWIRVVGTYPDRVVYCVTEYGDSGAPMSTEDDDTYYEADYSVGDQGQVIVGVPHEVEVSATVTEKSDDPLVAALETAGEMITQVKAGRPVSYANLAKTRAAHEALGDVLTASEPEYKAEDGERVLADLAEAITDLSEVKEAVDLEVKGSPDQARDDHGRWSSGGGDGGGSSGVGANRASLLSEHHRGLLTKARSAVDHVLRSASSLSALSGFPNAAKDDESGEQKSDEEKADEALFLDGWGTKASTSLSTDARSEAADKGKALPDGSYPTRTRAEFDKAVSAIGRAGAKGSDGYNKVKSYLTKRAKDEGWEDGLPDDWKSDSGSKGDGSIRIEVKADPMAKKPHDYKPGDDGKCATCGTAQGNPMHHVKADPSNNSGGNDYEHHDFVPGGADGGTCTVCGRNKGDPIHELPEAKADLLALVDDLLDGDLLAEA